MAKKRETDKSSSKKRLKKSAFEWGGILAVIGILYITGWHTEVIGTMQRALLWTGIFDAETTEIEKVAGPDLRSSDYDFTLAQLDGEELRLGKYKGKVLFINFWASWCPPCVAEMPTIENLYGEVGDHEDIRFLLISLDENHQKARNFMERKDFPMPYMFPVSGFPGVFEHQYIPTTFIVSKEGQIVYKREGIADYSSERFKEWMLNLANDKR